MYVATNNALYSFFFNNALYSFFFLIKLQHVNFFTITYFLFSGLLCYSIIMISQSIQRQVYFFFSQFHYFIFAFGLFWTAETEDQDIKISAPEVSPDTSSSKDDEIQLQPPSPAQTSPYNLRRRPQRSDFSSTPSPETVTQEELTTEPIIFPVETSSPVSEEYEPNFEFHHERPDAAADDTETAADLDSKSKTQDPSKTEVQPPSTFDAKALELLRVVVCVMTSLFSRSVLALGFGLFMVEVSLY